MIFEELRNMDGVFLAENLEGKWRGSVHGGNSGPLTIIFHRVGAFYKGDFELRPKECGLVKGKVTGELNDFGFAGTFFDLRSRRISRLAYVPTGIINALVYEGTFLGFWKIATGEAPIFGKINMTKSAS
jgi:hypothetical protein